MGRHPLGKRPVVTIQMIRPVQGQEVCAESRLRDFPVMFLANVPIFGSMAVMEIDMSAFLDGFFSVFRCPFSVPNDILSMDWDGDRYIIKPSGDLVEPSDIRTAWKKVGNYLRTAMTEYEYHIQQ